MSKFPVTVDDVGLMPSWSRRRSALVSPIVMDGGSWPRKLESRENVMVRLVSSFVVCGGARCEDWHDAIDAAFVAKHIDGPDELLDEMHVMTTWHDGECTDDVGFFFVLNTNFDSHDFQHYLVLHIGRGREMEHVDTAVRKYALREEV